MRQNTDLKHRRAECRLKVLDMQGEPLRNTMVSVKQTQHEFLFGGGAFDFIPFVNNDGTFDEKMLKIKTDLWLDVFNYATLPFYWGGFEPEEGKPDTFRMKKTAEYLKQNNIVIKGHPLCWHTVCADWLLQYDNQTILDKQLKRIERDVTDFRGLIDKWDVINEVVIMPIFDKYDNAVTRICKEYGQVNLVKKVFDATRAFNPTAELLLNDFNTSEEYAQLIANCLDAGVEIDTIGIQSHQHQGYWGKDKIEEVLERFERFNLPIHFTENTILSGTLVPPKIEDLNDWQVKDWPSTEEGEERQKEQMEEMYRILFSHPQVKAITGWDFSDGNWLNAPSGIIRRDITPKPAYQMLKSLIKKEWFTKCELQTDEEGFLNVNGFKGDYEITAKDLYGSWRLSDLAHEGSVTLQRPVGGNK